MNKSDKIQLRKTLRQRRRSLTAQEQFKATQAITRLVGSLAQWPNAQRIALYHAADGEIGTQGITDLCRTQGKQIYLPVIYPNVAMDFAQWCKNDVLVKNSVGIFEPPAQALRCPIAELDILFLPLVGWDKHGGRLGMGGGYYDKALAGVTGPLLIGLAHKNQEAQAIPRDSWDIPLHAIITNQCIYHCRA